VALPEEYLTYPHRRQGMDHDIYPYSNLFTRRPVEWPGGARLALWITVALEYFPLTPNDGPFRAAGHMATPYPDYRTYTTRDYGNRVGVFRIFRVLDALGLRASAVMNAAVAERYPPLAAELARRGWEVIAHGQDMNAIHYGGLAEDEERAQIAGALDSLTRTMGARPAGWLSPGRGESENTLRLLAGAGVSYVGDWVNDDMPYRMQTAAGEIVSMPMTSELEDRQLLIALGHREETYVEQVLDAHTLFDREAARHGGRILHLALTPYVIGQPFRIHALKEALSRILDKGGVWPATGAEILSAWTAQQ